MTGIHATPEERVGWEVDREEYDRIRATFIKHAEAEATGDIDSVIETLTEDCVYELVQTGQRWDGLDGARRFYDELLRAFPDNAFELHDVVIGPQGVLGVTTMTAHMRASFAGVDRIDREVRWRLVNMFPWDPRARKFAGETLYYFRPEEEYRLGQ